MKCGVELTSSTRSMVCGCENMMSLHDDTVSAKNLSEVQIIEQVEEQIDEQGGTRLAQREMSDCNLLGHNVKFVNLISKKDETKSR